MKTYKYLRIVFIFFGIFYVLFPKIAFAYLDPGTGSYMLQVLIASILGAFFTIKIFWGKIRNFFLKLFSKKKIDSDE